MFRSRRLTVALLAGCLGLAAILLVALNAFNLHFLNPRDSNGIFLYTRRCPSWSSCCWWC